MTRNYFILILVLSTFFSCQKEINVDLNESSPKVIIEANYIANDSIVQVKVSKTSSYFDEFSYNFIDGATVTIRENNGTETAIPFVVDGIYELHNYIPNYGATYTVTVNYDGTDYSASSLLMARMDLLPSTTQFQEASIFSDAGYWIYYRFQDYPGVGNCYKLFYTYNGITYDKFREFSSGDDKYTDGNLIERPLIETFQLGDTVIFELQSINQQVYDYYSQLSDNTSGFTAAAGNPDYFWSNEALGYFSAYAYSRDTVIIQ